MSEMPKTVGGRTLHDLGDYQAWGHAFYVHRHSVDFKTLDLLEVFRSTNIEVGDYLAIPSSGANEARSLYEVITVSRRADPGDQHMIKAEWRKWPKVEA